tara:strand:- start:4103 stop:4258 length:156 start_codon:yes stop_codon:yes gene_type:complete
LNGFTSYLVTYSILGAILSYYIIFLGRKLNDIKVRIKEAELKIKSTISKED